MSKNYLRVVVNKEAMMQLPNSVFLQSFITNDLFFKCKEFIQEGHLSKLTILAESADGEFELILQIPTSSILYVVSFPEEKKTQFGF